MAKFQIGVVSLNRNRHALCFMEVMRSMAAALRALGHEVEYAGPGATGRMILFGANNLEEHPENPIPADAIIYNAEQLAAIKDPRYFLQGYAQQNRFKIWDYARANVEALRSIGVTNVSMCPVGYVSEAYDHHYRPRRPRILQRTPDEEDIDVLFYGSVAGPRREILDKLDAAGLKVKRLFDVYGDERDEWISRSKLVLNLHFYPRGVFEIFRVSHLLENRRCVVTEAGGIDGGLEALAQRSCAYVLRTDIVDACLTLVGDVRKRRDIAERGFEEFKKIDFVKNVHKALEES